MKYPHVHEFMLEHGRLPFLGDERPPWEYRGWLLPQIQICHCHPAVVNRWGYYFRLLETGRLIDEPIPQIQFAAYGRDFDLGLKHLWKCVEILDHCCGGWDSLMAFIDWLAFAVGIEEEPAPRIDAGYNERPYRTFNLEYWLKCPSDYFGVALCERPGSRRNPTGFYPTPHPVVELMTQMTFGAESGDTRSMTVMEPCVGTGRILMHASNYSLRLYGMDIDRRCVQCSLINSALYVPWMLFPLPPHYFEKPTSDAPDVAEDRRDTSGAPSAINGPVQFGLFDGFGVKQSPSTQTRKSSRKGKKTHV